MGDSTEEEVIEEIEEIEAIEVTEETGVIEVTEVTVRDIIKMKTILIKKKAVDSAQVKLLIILKVIKGRLQIKEKKRKQ